MSGLDKLFSGMRIASSSLKAERTRIDVIAENIANARTTRTADGGPYRRKMVLFEPIFEKQFGAPDRALGVRVKDIVRDENTPFTRVHEPDHPDADEDGFVEYPNVNTVIEMADLVSAMRSYETSVAAQESFVRMAERALRLAQ